METLPVRNGGRPPSGEPPSSRAHSTDAHLTESPPANNRFDEFASPARSDDHALTAEDARAIRTSRSHSARAHRAAKDHTLGGVFDSGASRADVEASRLDPRPFKFSEQDDVPHKRVLPSKKNTTERTHRTHSDGRASVYEATSPSGSGDGDSPTVPGAVTTTGHGVRGDAWLDLAGVHESDFAQRDRRERSSHEEDHGRGASPGAALSSSVKDSASSLETSRTSGTSDSAYAATRLDSNSNSLNANHTPATTTPISTQRAPLRSLRDYERAHPEESPEYGQGGLGTVDGESGLSAETLMESGGSGTSSAAEGGDGKRSTRNNDDPQLERNLERIKGVALMLESAFVDDLCGVLVCVDEYGLDLLSVQCVNMSGTSALHAAARGGGMNVVRHLVTKACADVNATDTWGNTPLDEARQEGHETLCRFLIAAGARTGNRAEVFSNSGSAHGDGLDRDSGDMAFLGMNTSSLNRTSCLGSNGNGSDETPHTGRRRGRRSSLSDLCLENLRDGRGGASISDAAYVALRQTGGHADGSGVRPDFDTNPGNTSSPSPERDTKQLVATPPMRSPPGTPSEDTPPSLSGYTFDRKRGSFASLSNANEGSGFRDGGDEWEVLACDVRVDKKVGEGAFGEIRKATWKGCEVAVKTLKADCQTDVIALKEFNREMSIWSRLVHPNVVQFLGVGYKRNIPRIMICEFMEGGSLQQKLMSMHQSGKKMLFDQGFALLKGIASAMTYMHSRRPFAVIHRDLKPANILLTLSGDAKVADFGLSKMLDIDTPRTPRVSAGNAALLSASRNSKDDLGFDGTDGTDAGSVHETSRNVPPSPCVFLTPVHHDSGYRKPTNEERAEADQLESRRNDYGEKLYSTLYDHSFLMTGETGAYKYMAPEVFKNEAYGLKCDVYSFAVIAYEVFEGLMLLRDPLVWARNAAGTDQVRPAWMFLPAYDTRRTAETTELMEQCWHDDPKERPTFMKIGSELRRIARILRAERPTRYGSSSKRWKNAVKKVVVKKGGSVKDGLSASRNGPRGSDPESPASDDDENATTNAPQCGGCVVM